MGMTKKRLGLIDTLRGITICSMILYHALWDLVYIYKVNLPFMHTAGAFLWQQSICWSFILISGFCWSMGQHPVRHGILVSALGILITCVTVWFMPDQRIVFGILTFLGSAMLILYPLDRFLRKIPPVPGALLSFFFFLFCYDVNRQMIGIASWHRMLPDAMYRNYLTAYLGFPFRKFFSTDYFSIFPWIFLYLTGYYLHKIYDRYLADKIDIAWEEKFFSRLGRYSLWIYMIHQPLLTAVFMAGSFLIR